MSYKVLRLMEYTYPDVEAADRDMRFWTVPATGSKSFGEQSHRFIRSTIIQYPEATSNGTTGSDPANNHTAAGDT